MAHVPRLQRYRQCCQSTTKWCRCYVVFDSNGNCKETTGAKLLSTVSLDTEEKEEEEEEEKKYQKEEDDSRI